MTWLGGEGPRREAWAPHPVCPADFSPGKGSGGGGPGTSAPTALGRGCRKAAGLLLCSRWGWQGAARGGGGRREQTLRRGLWGSMGFSTPGHLSVFCRPRFRTLCKGTRPGFVTAARPPPAVTRSLPGAQDCVPPSVRLSSAAPTTRRESSRGGICAHGHRTGGGAQLRPTEGRAGPARLADPHPLA